MLRVSLVFKLYAYGPHRSLWFLRHTFLYRFLVLLFIIAFYGMEHLREKCSLLLKTFTVYVHLVLPDSIIKIFNAHFLFNILWLMSRFLNTWSSLNKTALKKWASGSRWMSGNKFLSLGMCVCGGLFSLNR